MSAALLDRDVRGQLGSLGRELGDLVGAHLAAAGQLLDSDPELAWAHAEAARERGGRLGVVREATGLAAYRSGRYAEALSELRTARRLTGSSVYLPVMADCERGLGRPERALDLAAGDEARTLDRDGQIELLIVSAGARADLGQPDAAVVALQVPELTSRRAGPALARLRYAYAEALAAVGREAEAQEWRARAIAADVDGSAGLLPDDDTEIFDLLDEDVELDEPAEEAAEQLPEQLPEQTVDDVDGDR